MAKYKKYIVQWTNPPTEDSGYYAVIAANKKEALKLAKRYKERASLGSTYTKRFKFYVESRSTYRSNSKYEPRSVNELIN